MRRRLRTLFALLVAGACSARDDAPRTAAPPPIGAACEECHPGYVASYRRTGMAQAAGPLRAGELRDLAAVADHDSGFRYAFDEDGDGARVVETFRSSTTSYPLAFAIGAGLLDRSYVARRGELSWFAPLEVVSAHGGRARHAALAPANEMQAGARLSLPITEECLACHTDRLPPRDYPLNRIPDDFAPQGITCAACHGDVDAHASWQETALGGSAPSTPDPVLAFGRAPLVDRLSVCARCHLQGDAWIALVPGDRGAPPPGGDLLQRRAVFVTGEPCDEIGFVSHVERMVLSRCFTRSLSSGGLACQSCHDPHRSTFEPESRREVRDACVRCHPGDGAKEHAAVPRERRAGSDCVSCHMRVTPVFDLEGVEIHDHLIARRPPPSPPAARLRSKASAPRDGRPELAIEPFAWPGSPPPASASDAGVRMMGELAAQHPDRAAALADAPPGELARRLPMYHHLRATVLERATRLADAEKAYREALALDPQQAESAVNLGALLGQLRRPREGIEVLDAVIARHPHAEGALRNRGLLKLSLGDAPGFAADLEAAYEILPHGPSARALAQYHGQRGDRKRADLWSERERASDPRGR